MSNSTFWPLFLIVAALSAAFVWRHAPQARDVLPNDVLHFFEDAGKRIAGETPFFETKDDGHPLPALVGKGEKPPAWTPASRGETDAVARSSAAAPATNAAPLLDPAVDLAEASARAEAAEKARAAASGKTKPALLPAARPGPKTKAPRDPSLLPQGGEAAFAADDAPAEVDPAALPAFRGVAFADPKKATWGVTARDTELEGFNHADLGKVGGGRFFLIERKMRREEGLTLVGNFTPKRLPQAVLVQAEDLICFTGSPEDLSEAQRNAVRKYYELRAEALNLQYRIEHPRYDDYGNVVNRGAKATDDPAYRAKTAEMKKLSRLIRGMAY